MKLTFLGTNGWYDTDTGNTVCALLDTKDYHIVLDAGNGIHRLDDYIKDEKPIYILLSHFHVEHIEGLHILNKFKFKEGIKIYGQGDAKRILNYLINKPFTWPIEKLPYEVHIEELYKGENKIPFPVTCKFLKHADPCLGFRIELDNKIVAYVADTGPCDNAIKISKNADLVLSECAFKSGTEYGGKWPHMTPESAAKMAKKANAKKLALFHFDAAIYKSMKEREEAEEIAKKIFPNTIAAKDLMEIEI